MTTDLALVGSGNMKLTRARFALDAAIQAGDPGAVAEVRSRILAVEEHLRRRGELLVQSNDLALLRFLAERWIGDYLKRTVRRGSHTKKLPPGISRDMAVVFRKIAAIPEETFRSICAAHRGSQELTTSLVLRLAGADGSRPARRTVRIDVEDAQVSLGFFLRAFPEATEAVKCVPGITRRSQIVALVVKRSGGDL
jgi:hypothetical protein